MSQLTYAALSKSEQVLLFISKIGLHFIRERLRAMGLDCFAGIERGNLRAFSVENLLPAPTKGVANLERIERRHSVYSAKLVRAASPTPYDLKPSSASF